MSNKAIVVCVSLACAAAVVIGGHPGFGLFLLGFAFIAAA